MNIPCEQSAFHYFQNHLRPVNSPFPGMADSTYALCVQMLKFNGLFVYCTAVQTTTTLMNLLH